MTSNISSNSDQDSGSHAWEEYSIKMNASNVTGNASMLSKAIPEKQRPSSKENVAPTVQRMNAILEAESADEVWNTFASQENVTREAKVHHRREIMLCYAAIAISIVAIALSIYTIAQPNSHEASMTDVEVSGPITAAVFSADNTASSSSAVAAPIIPSNDDSLRGVLEELKRRMNNLRLQTLTTASDLGSVNSTTNSLLQDAATLKKQALAMMLTVQNLLQDNAMLTTTSENASHSMQQPRENVEVVVQDAVTLNDTTASLSSTTSNLQVQIARLAHATDSQINVVTGLGSLTTTMNSTTLTLQAKTSSLTATTGTITEHARLRGVQLREIDEEYNETRSNLTDSTVSFAQRVSQINEEWNETAENVSASCQLHRTQSLETYAVVPDMKNSTQLIRETISYFQNLTEEYVLGCTGFHFDKSCFWFDEGSRNHADTQVACERSHGHLAYITDSIQFTIFLNHFRRRSTTVRLWLGAQYDQSSGNITLDNGEAVSFVSWASGYPSSTEGATRMGFQVHQDVSSSSNGMINSRESTNNLNGMCQREFEAYT